MSNDKVKKWTSPEEFEAGWIELAVREAGMVMREQPTLMHDANCTDVIVAICTKEGLFRVEITLLWRSKDKPVFYDRRNRIVQDGPVLLNVVRGSRRAALLDGAEPTYLDAAISDALNEANRNRATL